jgi:hypothetical protein
MSKFFSATLATVLLCSATVASAAGPDVETFLAEGRLADGQRELTKFLAEHPDDDQARLGLGAIQMVRAVEHLAQSLHRYGALSDETRLRVQVPLLPLPVPENEEPEKIRYADVRRILEDLLADLAKAEATLAKVDDPKVKLPLRFGMIRLDVDNNGKAEEHERLWRMYAKLNPGAGLPANMTNEEAALFIIAFDYADAIWMRGYCHLLSAMCETTLMYDQQTMFDIAAPYMFAKPDVAVLPKALIDDRESFTASIVDLIAAIHMMRPVKEAERGPKALAHLEAVIDLSRQNWKAIQAETNDDYEWIPSPRQTGVIPGVRVNDLMIAGWHDFLDEAEQLLQGKKLVPHWRIHATHGVNLRKVFTEPREFDLIMWGQGAGALPYLEEGVTTRRETWNRFERIFAGEFIGFAMWFN